MRGVFGLDERPLAGRRPEPRPGHGPAGGNGTAGNGGRSTALDVAKIYDFPTGVGGGGQTIGILEFDGGYLRSDLAIYFGDLGIAVPQVSWVNANNPAGGRADEEVALDIQVAGSIAPDARIVVYFTTDDEQGWVNGLGMVVNDTVNQPSVISISWVFDEPPAGNQLLVALHGLLQQAASMGITVCAGSGDMGSDNGKRDGKLHVYYPPTDPYVLACGGTMFLPDDLEVTWNDGISATGGGVSMALPLPDWQAGAGVPNRPDGTRGRGIPDVSGVADTIYNTVVHGAYQNLGGTSAVAPLWAGLVACFNRATGTTMGHLNPFLYESGTGGILDITLGTNDLAGLEQYLAGPGWDACTGLGRPGGTALLNRLGSRIGMIGQDNLLSVKEGTLAARWVKEADQISSFSLTPSLIGVLAIDGTLQVKQGNLNTSWVPEAQAVQAFQLAGDRIGILQTDGTMSVKEGGLQGTWVPQSLGAQAFAITANRIASLSVDRLLHVKEGALTANWAMKARQVQSFQLWGDRVGYLGTDGFLRVKEGPLDADWVIQRNGVQAFALDGDRIAVLTTDGLLLAKEGGLMANWAELADGGVSAFLLWATRIAVLMADGTLLVKEGPLDADWVTEATGVQQVQLSGDRIAILTTGSMLLAKEGGLSTNWVIQAGSVKAFGLCTYY